MKRGEREKCKCRTYIKYFVLLALVDPASQAAVSQSVLDDVFVGLGAWLLVQLGSLWVKNTDMRPDLVGSCLAIRLGEWARSVVIPVYSALEGVDEVVESFSQSFSSFRLPVEGHEEKPSAESGLTVRTHKPTNDARRPTREARGIWGHAHTRRAHAQIQTRGETRSDPACCRTFTSQPVQLCSCAARGPRKACSAKQRKVWAQPLGEKPERQQRKQQTERRRRSD